MVLAGNHAAVRFDERTPLRYYRASLKMVRELLLHSQYAQTDEILAACIILSTWVSHFDHFLDCIFNVTTSVD